MYLYGSADRSFYLYIKCVVAQPGGVSLVPTDEKLVQLRLGEKTKIISLASDRQEQNRRNIQYYVRHDYPLHGLGQKIIIPDRMEGNRSALYFSRLPLFYST